MAAAPRQCFTMPGAFTPLASSRDRDPTDAYFAPIPRSPSAGETTSRHMTDSGARKRTRDDRNSTPQSYFQVATPDTWIDNSGLFSRITDTKSPPPLANDRYRLAGGMDGSDNVFTRQHDNYDDYFNLEKQRGMWSAPTSPPTGVPAQLTHHLAPTPSPPKPWVLNQLMSLVGGVAGKLVHFCAVPFRGFAAGGGQAYNIPRKDEVATADYSNDPFLDDRAAGAVQYPIARGFPDHSYGVRSIDSIEDERPRPKRLRTGESWVMVEQSGETISRPASPRLSERRVPTHTRSPSQIPRPISRASGAATPSRPSLIPMSRRSTMDKKTLQLSSTSVTPKASSRPREYSRQNYGSPAMFRDTTQKKTSPLPPESQRLINKMRREELEDDARMRRMSSQMSAMLREAQEALGSSIEIGSDYMDTPNPGLNDEGYWEDAHRLR